MYGGKYFLHLMWQTVRQLWPKCRKILLITVRYSNKYRVAIIRNHRVVASASTVLLLLIARTVCLCVIFCAAICPSLCHSCHLFVWPYCQNYNELKWFDYSMFFERECMIDCKRKIDKAAPKTSKCAPARQRQCISWMKPGVTYHMFVEQKRDVLLHAQKRT